MAEWRHYGVPDPQFIDFPNNLPPGTRVVWMTREILPITPQDGIEIGEFSVKARDEYSIKIRFYRQTGKKDLPLLIYMHGGGYVIGSLETDDRSCRAIASELPILVLNVEYRLAPENKFPVGILDCWDIIKWATTREAQVQLSIDLQKGFILGGTSAGGNFTAGISHLAVQEKLSPPLTGLIFMAMNICHPDARPEKYRNRLLSVDEVSDAPGLTREAMDFFAEKYGGEITSPLYSPLLFPSHASLAQKAFFQVCGWDPRRDDSLVWEQILKDEGVETKLQIYSGLIHGFWTVCPDLPVSRKAEKDLIDGVRWLLEP